MDKEDRLPGIAIDWDGNLKEISPEESDYFKKHLIPLGWSIITYSD